MKAAVKMMQARKGTLTQEHRFTEVYEATGTLAQRRTSRLKAATVKIGAANYMKDSIQNKASKQ